MQDIVRESAGYLPGACRIPTKEADARSTPEPAGASRGYIPDGHRRNWDLSFNRGITKCVASCGVVDRAFGAQQGAPGSIPGRSTGPCPNMCPDVVPLGKALYTYPPQTEGQVSIGSCLLLADESSARRDGVVKANLESNQVCGSQIRNLLSTLNKSTVSTVTLTQV
ncbi:hypothetical protein Bbelb_396900 [Branchiostoma belcheri]|nr:hypothetical protein Bbelb_396900 [Branchiostoma belcheri]